MERQLDPWIATAIAVGSAVLLYVLLINVGARAVERIRKRSPQSAARVATLWVMGRRVAQFVLLALGLLILFDIWGLSLAPFLAIGTILGAAIGFGAREVVRDVLAGFFILAEDQYQIGDSVSIADASGTVEDIQFRVTVLRDLEGNVHYVPNGQIVVTSNFTSLYARPVVDISIGYNADVDRAMEVMLDELSRLASDPDWAERITQMPEMLGVQELAASAVILRARLTTVADQRWSVRREALRRVKNRFDAEGIGTQVS
ncbi:MAG: mechanosensitive ion channel family protein [Acidimicrobiia bacterium]